MIKEIGIINVEGTTYALVYFRFKDRVQDFSFYATGDDLDLMRKKFGATPETTVNPEYIKSIAVTMDGLVADVRRLKESNEQRKKDIKHSWNVCEKLFTAISDTKKDVRFNGEKLNQHMIAKSLSPSVETQVNILAGRVSRLTDIVLALEKQPKKSVKTKKPVSKSAKSKP